MFGHLPGLPHINNEGFYDVVLEKRGAIAPLAPPLATPPGLFLFFVLCFLGGLLLLFLLLVFVFLLLLICLVFELIRINARTQYTHARNCSDAIGQRCHV